MLKSRFGTDKSLEYKVYFLFYLLEHTHCFRVVQNWCFVMVLRVISLELFVFVKFVTLSAVQVRIVVLTRLGPQVGSQDRGL